MKSTYIVIVHAPAKLTLKTEDPRGALERLDRKYGRDLDAEVRKEK